LGCGSIAVEQLRTQPHNSLLDNGWKAEIFTFSHKNLEKWLMLAKNRQKPVENRGF